MAAILVWADTISHVDYCKNLLIGLPIFILFPP